MKKFFKFCGTLALVLIVLGVILWGIGTVTVGTQTMNEMVQKLTNGKIVMDLEGARVSIENVLESNAIYDIDEAQTFDYKYDVWKGNVEKTLVSEQAVIKLDIELGGCMFEIKDSEDDAIYVEYNGTGKSQAYVKDDKLHVKVLNGNNWSVVNWNQDSNSNCMTLYMPLDTVVEEIDLDLGAGQMKLDYLKAKEVEMDLGAGQILAEGMQVEKIALSIGAGDIVLEQAQLGEVQTKVGAGNCEISGTVTGDIDAECAMGNVTFKLAGAETDFNYEIQCVTGNITVGEREYSGVSQEQSINNQSAKTMDLECAMGNVEVFFE